MVHLADVDGYLETTIGKCHNQITPLTNSYSQHSMGGSRDPEEHARMQPNPWCVQGQPAHGFRCADLVFGRQFRNMSADGQFGTDTWLN